MPTTKNIHEQKETKRNAKERQRNHKGTYYRRDVEKKRIRNDHETQRNEKNAQERKET